MAELDWPFRLEHEVVEFVIRLDCDGHAPTGRYHNVDTLERLGIRPVKAQAILSPLPWLFLHLLLAWRFSLLRIIAFRGAGNLDQQGAPVTGAAPEGLPECTRF